MGGSYENPYMGAILGRTYSRGTGEDIYTTPPATPLESVFPPKIGGAMGLGANPKVGC